MDNLKKRRIKIDVFNEYPHSTRVSEHHHLGGGVTPGLLSSVGISIYPSFPCVETYS